MLFQIIQNCSDLKGFHEYHFSKFFVLNCIYSVKLAFMGRNNLGVASLIFFAIANILDLVFGWIFYVSVIARFVCIMIIHTTVERKDG